MIRRFANIVAERGSSGKYSLHRLDISKRLFYPSTAVADEASKKNGKMATLPRLPAPVIRFHPSQSSWGFATLEFFALLCPRSSEDKIICSDSDGHTVLYQADSHSIHAMPSFNGDKGFMPTTISVARPDTPLEDLYILSSALSSFDVLSFGSCSNCQETLPMSRKRWHFDRLPPPPFTANICSHTVVDDGNTICVSSVPSCGRTYYFDTLKRKWRQAAGDWVLPFVGRAEYIPDLKLWLGFAADSEDLCAWDLSMDKPPTLLLCTDLKTPEDWSATSLSILNLGAGRFCIAKIFRAVDNTAGDSSGWDREDKFAVLTGVEMVMSGRKNKVERMVQHKSVKYMFANDRIRWVL